MEENRFINRLNQTNNKFNMTAQERACLVNTGRGGGLNRGVFTSEGGIANLQVPLKDVLGSALNSLPNQGVLPSGALGNITYDIELEDQQGLFMGDEFDLSLVNMTCNNSAVAGVGGLALKTVVVAQEFSDLVSAQMYFMVGNDITIVGTNGGTAVRTKTVITNVAWALNVVTLTVLDTIVDLANTQQLTNITFVNTNQFWSAADVAISANVTQLTIQNVLVSEFIIDNAYKIGYLGTSAGAGANAQYFAVVGTLQAVVQAGANVTATFDAVYVNATARALTNVSVTVGNVPLTYSINRASLVAYRLATPKLPNEYEWYSYKTEMDNMLATSDYRKQFDIQPATDLVQVLTPINHLISVLDNANSYRNTIDGVDTITRDVMLNDGDMSLYFDRLISNFDGLKSLDPWNGGEQVVQLVEVMPEDGRPHTLQVRLATTGGNMTAKVVYVFKRVLNAVKL